MSWKPTTEPVVITCALTGGIHGKEANDALPEQPDEIVAQGIDAWRAGAAVLHVHARNPDGSNTMDPEIYGELHERLCAETDAVVQLTTGGSPRLSVEERITTVRLAPEMCSLNMGLLNFFIRGEQVFFPNHRDDIERFAHEIREHDVRPELEVYSVAMLEEVEHLLSLEILEPPYAINLVLHTPTQGGQRGTPRNLVDAVERDPRPLGRPRRRAGDGDLDGPDAAAAHHDRHRDGVERARGDGGQRPLPPRRAGRRQRAARRADRADRQRARPAARVAGRGARAVRAPRTRGRRRALLAAPAPLPVGLRGPSRLCRSVPVRASTVSIVILSALALLAPAAQAAAPRTVASCEAARVDKAAGVARTLSDCGKVDLGRGAEGAARQAIGRLSGALGVRRDTSDLGLMRNFQKGAGPRLRFQQFVKGVPVRNGQVAVALDKRRLRDPRRQLGLARQDA